MNVTFSPQKNSATGQRIVIAICVFVLFFFMSMMVAGIFGSSNIVWGEDNQYGRIDIPGSKIVTLPAGQIIGSVAVALPGRGNATPDLRLPDDLSLDIAPVNGGQNPIVTQNVGDSENANDDLDDTQIQVWLINIPTAGDYRVNTNGDFSGLGVNVQLWLGHGPPLPGTDIPIIGLVCGVVAVLAWLIWPRRKK